MAQITVLGNLEKCIKFLCDYCCTINNIKQIPEYSEAELFLKKLFMQSKAVLKMHERFCNICLFQPETLEYIIIPHMNSLCKTSIGRRVKILIITLR